ncbi:uncharacterized protein BCR38DRAFT_506687 [Pseudomassariella vexata]|uniref:Uncharacterized protein n=1 Tax=Pseudomassariella vexata TaxID=1141098 RepID=A0A1Y2E9N4_9PEZI|nr:uncharacterized protein BCR38DRAFT_506687 [Pseudomassariella vexata]ORY68259.1 hypothetical protein BCR38DRAFT_506687 [Pseudomassariella vexata]
MHETIPNTVSSCLSRNYAVPVTYANLPAYFQNCQTTRATLPRKRENLTGFVKQPALSLIMDNQKNDPEIMAEETTSPQRGQRRQPLIARRHRPSSRQDEPPTGLLSTIRLSVSPDSFPPQAEDKPHASRDAPPHPPPAMATAALQRRTAVFDQQSHALFHDTESSQTLPADDSSEDSPSSVESKQAEVQAELYKMSEVLDRNEEAWSEFVSAAVSFGKMLRDTNARLEDFGKGIGKAKAIGGVSNSKGLFGGCSDDGEGGEGEKRGKKKRKKKGKKTGQGRKEE